MSDYSDPDQIIEGVDDEVAMPPLSTETILDTTTVHGAERSEQIKRLKARRADVMDAERSLLLAYVALGDELKAQQATMNHGEWLDHLKVIDYCPRRAQEDMAIAEMYHAMPDFRPEAIYAMSKRQFTIALQSEYRRRGLHIKTPLDKRAQEYVRCLKRAGRLSKEMPEEVRPNWARCLSEDLQQSDETRAFLEALSDRKINITVQLVDIPPIRNPVDVSDK